MKEGLLLILVLSIIASTVIVWLASVWAVTIAIMMILLVLGLIHNIKTRFKKGKGM